MKGKQMKPAPKNMPPKNMPSKGMPPKNMPPKNMPSKGMPPKGMGPGMHKMPGGMMMKDSEMKTMMGKPAPKKVVGKRKR